MSRKPPPNAGSRSPATRFDADLLGVERGDVDRAPATVSRNDAFAWRLMNRCDRTAMANNNKADMFISLHVNGVSRGGRRRDDLVAAFDAADIASNRVAGERLPAFGGGMRDIELVPWDLAQIRHLDQSDAFADLVVEELKDHVPLASKPIDHAPLRVLESANMPAVMVEIGYLSNPAQEKQIASGEFQTAIVQALVDAIVRFRDVVAPSEGASR